MSALTIVPIAVRPLIHPREPGSLRCDHCDFLFAVDSLVREGQKLLCSDCVDLVEVQRNEGWEA